MRPFCPRCNCNFTPSEVRDMLAALPAAKRASIAAAVMQSRRKGGAGGRPKLDVPHCACGKYTLTTAHKRRHVCGEAAIKDLALVCDIAGVTNEAS